jgi:hypothetical protein
MPPRKRVGDLTGLENERLQKENMEELKKRAAEISLMAEIVAEENAEPVDYSDGPLTSVVSDLELGEVTLDVPTRTIIPLIDIEQMTFGAGNYYDFEAGRKYVVTSELANHLKAKGLISESNYR